MLQTFYFILFWFGTKLIVIVLLTICDWDCMQKQATNYTLLHKQMVLK